MTSRRTLLTNAAVNVLGFAAQIAVSFALAPVVLRALGDARYGAWSFVEPLIECCLADAGFQGMRPQYAGREASATTARYRQAPSGQQQPGRRGRTPSCYRTTRSARAAATPGAYSVSATTQESLRC